MATAQAISWRERLSAYYYLCRFDKPIGTELVFWPTMWALWVAAKGIPDLSILMLMILGVILMRAAGCAINELPAVRWMDMLSGPKHVHCEL